MILEKILKQLEEYWENQKIKEAIELAEKAIQIYHDDYRLYSTLCRCYNRLLPTFVLNYDTFSIDQINLFNNYSIKALKYCEQGLFILLEDKSKIDKGLILTSFMLQDLTNSLQSHIDSIFALKKENIEMNFASNVSTSLFNLLLKCYQKGFESFDQKFEHYRELYHIYNEITQSE